MWSKVASRKHTAEQIFSGNPNGDEVMIHGTVEYEFKAGGRNSVDWAARAHLVEDGEGVVRMDFYQVYLVRGNFRRYVKR